MLARTSGAVRLLRAFGSESSLTLHSSFRCLTLSRVRSVSVLFQPVRWGSPPKVVQLPRPNWAGASIGNANRTGSNIAILISGASVYPAGRRCQTRIGVCVAGAGMMKNMNRAALLIPFLAICLTVAQAQDLPAGKGKDLVENTCGSCHGLDVVVAQHATKDGWASIVDYMVSRGATGTPEEIATIVDYLAKNFPAATTTNVNKATSMDLQSQLGLTSKDADAIVEYRGAHGDFKDFDSLSKVPGIDTAALTAKKDSIVFADPPASK